MVRMVEPVEIIAELRRPVWGLKLLPAKTAQFLRRYLEGIRETACCWIWDVLLVAFTTITRKGQIERRAKNMQTAYIRMRTMTFPSRFSSLFTNTYLLHFLSLIKRKTNTEQMAMSTNRIMLAAAALAYR